MQFTTSDYLEKLRSEARNSYVNAGEHFAGDEECYKYHTQRYNELSAQANMCERAKGFYVGLSANERSEMLNYLHNLEESHRLKAKLFGMHCGLYAASLM